MSQLGSQNSARFESVLKQHRVPDRKRCLLFKPSECAGRSQLSLRIKSDLQRLPTIQFDSGLRRSYDLWSRSLGSFVRLNKTDASKEVLGLKLQNPETCVAAAEARMTMMFDIAQIVGLISSSQSVRELC